MTKPTEVQHQAPETIETVEWFDSLRILRDALRVLSEAQEARQKAEAERDEARKENDHLRASLANSGGPCVYCNLPREEWSSCKTGFPGCARGDDAMLCMHVGAAMGEYRAGWIAGRDAAAERAKAAKQAHYTEGRLLRERSADRHCYACIMARGDAASALVDAIRALTPPEDKP